MLTQVAGTQVCPSDDVDQAWHLHITRTADYERFCREVLGRFLHHRPAESGPDEHARHRAMYEATLSHYRRAFRAPAPLDVWPTLEQRFAPLPSPPGTIRLHGEFASTGVLTITALLTAVALALLLGRLGVLDATHEIGGPRFLAFAFPATLVLLLLSWLSTGPYERAAPRDTLDPYEAAWLAGDTPRLASTAIGLLVDRGILRVRVTDEGVGRRRRAVTRLVVASDPRAEELHPVEAACLAAARDGVLSFERAQRALQTQALQIRKRLRGAGLATDPATIAPPRAAMAIVAGLWLAIEIERVVHALQTPRPMNFLVLLTLATAVVLVALTLRGGHANRRGRDVLRGLGDALRREHVLRGERARPGRTEPPIAARHLPMTLAILGPGAVLAQPGFTGLDDAIGPVGMRQARSAGDGAGGSSCSGGGGGCSGGGGCGGGCGGCGG
ncbi:MAG: TIGR04222 domain-containing membrane protein [Burkholderiaceae bacterium]